MTGVDTDISQCIHTCRYRQTDADTRIARYSNRKTSIFIDRETDTQPHTHIYIYIYIYTERKIER